MDKNKQGKKVNLEVYRIIDYTFRINKDFEISRDAERIIIECYDDENHLLSKSMISDSNRSGLKTYNKTFNLTNGATLRNKKRIRKGIIEKYHLSESTRLSTTLTIKDDGTHLYKIIIPNNRNCSSTTNKEEIVDKTDDVCK